MGGLRDLRWSTIVIQRHHRLTSCSVLVAEPTWIWDYAAISYTRCRPSWIGDRKPHNSRIEFDVNQGVPT